MKILIFYRKILVLKSKPTYVKNFGRQAIVRCILLIFRHCKFISQVVNYVYLKGQKL
jgi:hypothetical protein